MNLLSKLEAVESQLANDPYQIDLLFEKVLLSIAQGAVTQAQHAFDIFSRFPGVDTHTSLLASIFDGTKELRVSERFWFVFPRNSDKVVQDFVMDLAGQHFQALVLLKGEAPDGIVLFEMTPYPISLMDYSLSGVNLIKLSGTVDTPQSYSAAIAHELSHVFWPCKNRVLSEGIALVYESKLAPEGAYVRSYEDALAYIYQYEGLVPSLPTLLSNSFKDDVLFKRNTSSSQEQMLIYNLAYVLMHHFVSHAQGGQVNALIDKINQVDDSQAYAVFNEFLSEDVEPFFTSLVSHRDEQQVPANFEEIEMSIVQDRKANEQVSFDKYYYRVERAGMANKGRDESQLMRIRLLLVKLYQQLAKQEDVDLVALSLAEQLTDALPVQGFQYEVAYLKARTGLIRLQLSKDVLEKGRLLSEVDALFAQSMANHSLSAEAYIDYAKFELSTPAAFGRDLGKVETLLSQMKGFGQYRDEIESLREQLALAS